MHQVPADFADMETNWQEIHMQLEGDIDIPQSAYAESRVIDVAWTAIEGVGGL